MQAFKGSLSERNSQVWESVLSSKTITTRVFLSQEGDSFIKAVVVSLNASLSLDQIYQTVRVPHAGNGPVFPPVLERLSVCRGRWPNRSVLLPGQPTGCVNTCVSRPSPSSPTWPCRRWNGLCQNQPLLGERKKKKSIHYMTAQSEVSEVPLPLLSLLVRKGTLKSTNDMYGRLVWHVAVFSECEGTHGCFVGMSAGFPSAGNSDAHVGGLFWCAPRHTQRYLKISAYVRAKKIRSWRGGFGSVSLIVEGLNVESSEMEQSMEKEAVPKVPRGSGEARGRGPAACIPYLNSAIRLPFCNSEGLRLGSCNDWVLFHVEESPWLWAKCQSYFFPLA